MHALLSLDNFLTRKLLRIDYRQEVAVDGKCETSIFLCKTETLKNETSKCSRRAGSKMNKSVLRDLALEKSRNFVTAL